MKKWKRLLIVVICILLLLLIRVVIGYFSVEGQIKRRYDLHRVSASYNDVQYSYGFILNPSDSDFEKYYGTKEGEDYLDSIVSDLIVWINEDRKISDMIKLDAVKASGKQFYISIQVQEKDEFGDSSARRYIGRYESEIYPTEEWFSDENKKVQRWIKYVWNVENDRPEEKGAFTLLELSQKGSGELEKSYEQHSDIGNVDGNTVGKSETVRLAGSTMQQKKELLEMAECGATVIFGSYEQDSNPANGKEDIEWQVLDRKDDELLLVSKYVLDCKQYNSEKDGTSWETCTLRSWLNGEFCDNAFGDEEHAMVLETEVIADTSNSCGTVTSCSSTSDRVFLLSVTETDMYFDSDEERKCTPTEYAKEQGAWTNGTGESGDKVMCWWWLRTTCDDFRHENVVRVLYDGTFRFVGTKATHIGGGVRPAIWVGLNPS